MSGAAFILAALAAALPTLVYVALVWWADRHEQEPLHLLAMTFLWGVLPAALLAVGLEVLLAVPMSALGDPIREWRDARLLAPAVEETVKGLALLGLFWWRRHEFNGVLDGIIYGAFIGLGFALTENFFAFATAFNDGDIAPAMVLVSLRTVLFGLNHPVFAALFGAGLGWACYHGSRPARIAVPAGCLVAGIGLHTLHNALAAGGVAGSGLILATVADWSGLALVGVLVGLSWRQEQRWLDEGLRAELALGTITPGEYALAVSTQQRAAAEWRAWRQTGWRRWRAVAHHLHALTELGFARYHQQHADRRPTPPPGGWATDVQRRRRLVQRTRLALLATGREPEERVRPAPVVPSLSPSRVPDDPIGCHHAPAGAFSEDGER